MVEVAAGLSPRGWRFANRFGDRITYVEADLPGMLANKRRILAELGGELLAETMAAADCGSDIARRALRLRAELRRLDAMGLDGRRAN